MAHACAASSSLHAVVAGDSDGVIHVLDPRAGGSGGAGSSACGAGVSSGGLSGWLAGAGGNGCTGSGRRGAEVLRAQVRYGWV